MMALPILNYKRDLNKEENISNLDTTLGLDGAVVACTTSKRLSVQVNPGKIFSLKTKASFFLI
jgi:hypothetical protein